jgi:hypothetical protein
MGALGAAGMLCVGQIANPRIGAQQGHAMSERLAEVAPETFERYADPEPISEWGYEFRPLDAAKLNAANRIELEEGAPATVAPIKEAELIQPDEKEALIAHADKDVPVVQSSYLFGGRRALTLTSYIPGTMAFGFLGLLIYFRSIGGYKVITLEGPPVEHEDTPDPLDQPMPSEY